MHENVDIYLRLIGELGLDETVPIDGDENVEEKKDSHQGNTAESKENRGAKRRADKKTTSDKTAPSRYDHTYGCIKTDSGVVFEIE